MPHSWTIRAGVLLTGCVCLTLPACGPTNGVDVINATDQVVKAEMLALDPHGVMTVYSTAAISPGSNFANRMEEAVRGQTLRVRFFLDEQTLEDENWVMLNLSEKTTRYYTLKIENGRLRAREGKRGRPDAEK